MADGEVIVHPSSVQQPRERKALRGPDGRLLPGHTLTPPSTYTPEMGERIASLLASQPRGLGWIATHVPGMPSYNTMMKWEDQFQDFAKLIAKARRQQAVTLVDECIEIADDTSNDRITVFVKGEPREVIDLAGIARSKIRIDTRIRTAKMWDPQRFGDRLDINARVGGFASQDEVIDELE